MKQPHCTFVVQPAGQFLVQMTPPSPPIHRAGVVMDSHKINVDLSWVGTRLRQTDIMAAF